MSNAAALLFQHFADRARDLGDAGAFIPPEPLPHADPYLLASLVQKAVRRGDTAMARRAGHQLLALDRSRLWRRLAVISLEDVGIGDTEAAAALVAIGTLPAARRLYGSDALALDAVLIRACSAAKDRTADHFSSIVGREPVDDADRAAINTASGNALLAMIASSQLPWTRRLRAAVRASGREEFMHPACPAKLEERRRSASGISAVLDVLHELGVSPLLITACEVYASRQRDLLPVFVPFAAILAATGCTIITHDLPEPEVINGWPAYVFDPLWTRIGKRAVDLWLRSYCTKPQWLPRQVTACLWNAESAACDRTLCWPLGDVIRACAYAADLKFRGLPVSLHAELNAWVANERPALTAARHAAFDSAIRATERSGTSVSQPNQPLQVRCPPTEPDLFNVIAKAEPQGRPVRRSPKGEDGRRMFKNRGARHV